MSLDSAKALVLSLVTKLGIGGEDAVSGDDGMFTLTLEQSWMPQIHICYISSDDSMIFFSEIGMLNADNEYEILRTMMKRQYLFADSNGVTTALSDDDNVLTAQLKFGIKEMSDDEFASLRNDFVGETAKLKVLVYGESSESPSDGSADIYLTDSNAFISV